VIQTQNNSNENNNIQKQQVYTIRARYINADI